MHSSNAHANAQMLSVTAKVQSKTSKAELLRCQGCSTSKGVKAKVAKRTPCFACSAFGRVFVELSGSHQEKSAGGAAYTIPVKDDHLRVGFVFFLKTEDEATENSQGFLPTTMDACVRCSVLGVTVGPS